ncbi:MAG TPA: DUF4982 domain-containing protein [Candidatus Eisenbergiella intestinipullorum]|nr:DUF4982 domain-containing protein [Candidatus Eisenbergiella intestinipullorum]
MDSTRILLNDNWKFHLGDAEEAWYKGYDDSSWQDVALPHDWSVSLPFSREYSSGTGYLAGGTGWYRLRFFLPEEYQGKKISVCFDGIYKNSQVWCNSYYLGKRPNGYVPVLYDISSIACFGRQENEISVKVTHTDIADSRWFTGSGITRKASVIIEEPVHPVPYGIFFSTLYGDAGKSAQVEISHELINETAKGVNASVTSSLTTPSGKRVLEVSASLELEPGKAQTVVLNGTVKNPQLWSPEHPALYTLTTELSVNGESPYRVYEGQVGIRTFRFDPDEGFFLNGRSMKLKGVCVHHDGGCLGAAMTREVWERRLLSLKEMGCNAIRTSHNPHMPELYDLCDRLGFLMMDEAFDEWENAKNKWSTGHNVYPPRHQGYFEDFPQWHEKDLAAMVLRDRNHPSVILWSIGNEIDYPNDPYCHPLFSEMTGNNDANKPDAERQYDPAKPNMERLAPIAARLANIVRRYDSTRPVTLAAAFPELSSQLHYFDALDVVGYNYKEHLYEEDHKRFPSLPFLGSENGHSLEAWKAVTGHDYISGQFLWTGIDYLGEAHGWPIHGSGAGLLTLAGFPKNRYYRRQSFWLDTPVLHLSTAPYTGDVTEYLPASDCWNYEAGEQILVRCYTNLPSVELFLNGRSLGTKEGLNEEGSMDWIVPFEAGELTAEGRPDTEGAEPVTFRLITTGEPERLLLNRWAAAEAAQPDAFRGSSSLLGKTGRVEQIEITLADCDGNPAVHKDVPVTAAVSGPGLLLGLENGDLADNTPYAEHVRNTLHGRLIAYVRRCGEGDITLSVCAEGCEEASIQLSEG